MKYYCSDGKYNIVNSRGGEIKGLYEMILKQPHTMIAGTTGSGKSVILNGLIMSVLIGHPNESRLVLLDPKKVELSVYKDMPHVLAYANESSDIADVLEEMCAEMDSRYRSMERTGKRKFDGHDTYIILDELADLLTSSEKKRVETSLQRLMQLGRAAKFHVILATQCPSRQILNAKIMVNVTCAIALHCKTAIESRQILNVDGAEYLPQYGQCIVSVPGKDVFRTDVYMYTDNEISDMVDYYLAQRTGRNKTSSAPVMSADFDYKKIWNSVKTIASVAFLIIFLANVL